MRDPDVRRVLHTHLRHRHRGEPDTVVVDELGVCNGASRVDVAVVGGHLSGWEIKGPRDRLDRLPSQVRFYSMVCDQAWLVTDSIHLQHALPMLPTWWGVMLLAQDASGTAALETVREPGWNHGHDLYALARLLWREETIDILVSNGAERAALARSPRAQLWDSLAALPADDVRSVVRDRLKARQRWRTPRQGEPRPRRRVRPFEVLATLPT